LHQLQRLAADYRTASRCARSAIQDYAALGAVLAGVQPVAGENGSRDAIAALKSLHADAEAAGDLYFAVRAATRIAAMLYALKQPVDALALFRPVLAAAATAGLCQSILDQGVETGPLLHAFVESEPPPRDEASLARYAERLLQRWGELYEPDESSGGAVVARILSPRERDILEQVAQGRSNKEMARALGIAPETVKSHLKHVFAKLGVDRRAQAAALAQSLGIVSRAAPGRV
jgi:LuxR family maltose regulon positive regulatory protein